MKTILFKSFFIFLLSFIFVQSSSAFGRYREHCERRAYYAPRYYGPRYVQVVAPCYARMIEPGHFIINRWGERIWVRTCYR